MPRPSAAAAKKKAEGAGEEGRGRRRLAKLAKQYTLPTSLVHHLLQLRPGRRLLVLRLPPPASTSPGPYGHAAQWRCTAARSRRPAGTGRVRPARPCSPSTTVAPRSGTPTSVLHQR
ncbi:hypothetical protein LV779_25815 [Streptomyces thinghirensis]|nr:hypothetical protein [Streptomyces thinghirensis]